MRIVQLANLVHRSSGGLRTVVDRLGHGYLAEGHERIVITPGRRERREMCPDGSVRITVPGVRVPTSGGYRLIADRARLRVLLANLAPDAVEISDRFTLPWAAGWARQRGIAATVIVHEHLRHVLATWSPVGRGTPGSSARRLARRFDVALARSAGPVVVPSRFAAQAFPDGAAQVVPWGVDLDRFHPDPARGPGAVARRGDEPIRLITVGRSSREKRPDLAIDVVRESLALGRRVHLEVIGDGPSRATLQRAAAGLPVTFRGHLDPHEVAVRLRAADVALAPCPAETFGLAALEALASGVPVVSVSSGAVPELLGLPTGSPAAGPAGAVASPTGRALEFAVQQVLDHPGHVRAAAARARAVERPWSVAVSALLARHRRAERLLVSG